MWHWGASYVKNSSAVLIYITLSSCLFQIQHHGSGIVPVGSLKYDNERWSSGNRASSSKSKEEVLQLNLMWWDTSNKLCKCKIGLRLPCIISSALGPQILFYWNHFEYSKSLSTCQTSVCLGFLPLKESQLQKNPCSFSSPHYIHSCMDPQHYTVALAVRSHL